MTLLAFPFATGLCPEPHCQGTADHGEFGHPHYEQTRWSNGRVTTRFWPTEFSDSIDGANGTSSVESGTSEENPSLRPCEAEVPVHLSA